MEDNKNNQQPQQLQLDLNPLIAAGVYSNLALISHAHSEFVLDFLSMLPGMPQPAVRNRVILAPEHAKRFLQALQENVLNYEREFGEIELPEQPPRTISPFGSGKGEA